MEGDTHSQGDPEKDIRNLFDPETMSGVDDDNRKGSSSGGNDDGNVTGDGEKGRVDSRDGQDGEAGQKTEKKVLEKDFRVETVGPDVLIPLFPFSVVR
jgi:hypothetical protein